CECQLQQLFGRIKGDSGVGAKLHGDRRDPGLHGGPRRLSTPTLPDSNQIRLGRGIHAADTPATGPTPPSTDFCGLPPTEKKKKIKSKNGLAGRFL
ncbi:hypothetical protein, partial [Stenotrophomonas sp. OVS01A]|uniref:hypothetical protein n=1 Tax=Stenotrophomonas sp. OVS01A TaxID=2862680 RepID=UPI001CBCE782